MPDPADYPWINDRKPLPDPIPDDLDGIPFPNHTHQIPCSNCDDENAEEVPGAPVGSAICGHLIDYAANQLIVRGATDRFVSEGDHLNPRRITPTFEGPEEAFQPDRTELYRIDPDPIEGLRTLQQIDHFGDLNHPEGFAAAPNYFYNPAPRWKFGPADTKTQANPGDQLQDPIFKNPDLEATQLPVIIIDNFGLEHEEGPEQRRITGHGEFICHLVDTLTDVEPICRDVQLQGEYADGERWDLVSDEWTISALVFSTVTASPGSVVNLSLGTYACEQESYQPVLLKERIEWAWTEHKSCVVAAAGNDRHVDGEPVFYPGGFEDVIGVGAAGWSAEEDWFAADFSNMNEVNVWAPGVAIVSKIAGTTFAWSGTSFAAPHVAAMYSRFGCPDPPPTS